MITSIVQKYESPKSIFFNKHEMSMQTDRHPTLYYNYPLEDRHIKTDAKQKENGYFDVIPV